MERRERGQWRSPRRQPEEAPGTFLNLRKPQRRNQEGGMIADLDDIF